MKYFTKRQVEGSLGVCEAGHTQAEASHSEAQAVSCLPATKELLRGQEQRELWVEVVMLWLQWQQLELCFPTPGPALNSCKRNVLYRARLNVTVS